MMEQQEMMNQKQPNQQEINQHMNEQELMNNQMVDNEKQNQNLSLVDKIKLNIKQPVVVALIAIIVSVPALTNMLETMIKSKESLAKICYYYYISCERGLWLVDYILV